jgi:D-beta-D-heptose 7-phosphate kinase/D-beta-D-heptose 1-phosphate adenosyltransferase
MDQMRDQCAAGRIVVVDPKQGNFDLYRGVSCATPNAREAATACHDVVESDEDALRVGRELRARLESEMLLITRGEHGMSLFRDMAAPVHLPTEAREVFDVTGAGDTVIACFTAFLAAGATPENAAALANAAAGIVVREIGTAAVTPAELRDAWSRRRGATT